jgi:hypothetical protein
MFQLQLQNASERKKVHRNLISCWVCYGLANLIDLLPRLDGELGDVTMVTPRIEAIPTFRDKNFIRAGWVTSVF